MITATTLAELRTVRASLAGRVGFVPTMGALHAGHAALVAQARAENDAVVVSVFVNPAQFAPTEDLSRYPRTPERDAALLASLGVDVVFAPVGDVMYPPGFQTYVMVEQVTKGLEGDARPSHLRGVATVVAKLFNMVQPHTAYFGQKDAQQVVMVRRMVADLAFPVRVVAWPTVREPDGLALSSRNAYLDVAQRAAAPALYRALLAAGHAYDAGKRAPEVLLARAAAVLAAAPPVRTLYISLNDARTLAPLIDMLPPKTPALLSVAAMVGSTRLIDNVLLPLTLNTPAGLDATLGGS